MPTQTRLNSISTSLFPGAATDKVAALEKAGAVVTDSPAKIGTEMVKVYRTHSFSYISANRFVGYEGSGSLVKDRFLDLVRYTTIAVT